MNDPNQDRLVKCISPRDAWNRCDVCGRFIPLRDFKTKAATRKLSQADSVGGGEYYETLCRTHREPKTVEVQTK